MKKKPVTVIAYIVLGGIFALGAYILVRSSILMPGEYHAPPAMATASPSAPAATPSPATNEAAPTPEPSPTPAPAYEIPVKIYFTAQEVSADIIPMALTEDNEVNAPSDALLGGWCIDSVPPGAPGNAILSGHDTLNGVKGTFSVIKKMSQGDEVVVEHIDGSFTYFEVIDINTYLAKDVPDDLLRLSRDGDARMTLFTCLGDYDSTGYSKSRVVASCVKKEA